MRNSKYLFIALVAAMIALAAGIYIGMRRKKPEHRNLCWHQMPLRAFLPLV